MIRSTFIIFALITYGIIASPLGAPPPRWDPSHGGAGPSRNPNAYLVGVPVGRLDPNTDLTLGSVYHGSSQPGSFANIRPDMASSSMAGAAVPHMTLEQVELLKRELSRYVRAKDTWVPFIARRRYRFVIDDMKRNVEDVADLANKYRGILEQRLGDKLWSHEQIYDWHRKTPRVDDPSEKQISEANMGYQQVKEQAILIEDTLRQYAKDFKP